MMASKNKGRRISPSRNKERRLERWSPKLTINDLPDELLVEIFDFYRRQRLNPGFDLPLHLQGNEDYWYYHWWSMKLEWFKLIHVCKRWRSVIFASSSRLDLCFVLAPRVKFGYEKKGNMKTIISRHFPPLPIAIDYFPCRLFSISILDIGRMSAAFKRPDRVHAITLITKSTTIFDKFFKVAKCPLPALESLELHNHQEALKIPETFLKGSNLPNLQTLKLHHISLPSTLRLLSSAPALTHLSLMTDADAGPLPARSLILCLQGMPCLCRLDLEINSFIDGMTWPTENVSLSKLTFFYYRGYSKFFNYLTAMLAFPSLQEVDIYLYDRTWPPIQHIIKFVNDIEEHFHVFKFILGHQCIRFFFLTHSEYVGRHSPRFTLRSNYMFESNWQMSSAFSAKLVTVQEVFVVFDEGSFKGIPIDFDDEDYKEMYSIPWRSFFLQIPRIKALHLENVDYPEVANALQEDGGGAHAFSALEEIELCSVDRQLLSSSEQVAIFQPFVYARQQAGLPIKVFCGKSLSDPLRPLQPLY